MTRYRLDLSYDGTDFHGWAAQPGLRTVQGELESWICTVLRLDAPVELVCAGRTDAGVHARGQVAHVDLPDSDADLASHLAYKLGRVLPPDLVVRRIVPAPAGFDARFSAIWRRYIYRLSETTPDPLWRRMVTRLPGSLDLAAVNAAAPALLGLHDFAPFCRKRPGATTIRTLLDLRAERVTDGELAGTIAVHVRADAFCHSMVRALVGALVEIGRGHHPLAWLERVMASPERARGSKVMPAHGLVLEEVGYPPDDQLAERAAQARARRDGEAQA